MLQGFLKFSAHVDSKSGVKGLKTGCYVPWMMYIVYLYSMECLLNMFMVILIMFMIMINLPK